MIKKHRDVDQYTIVQRILNRMKNVFQIIIGFLYLANGITIYAQKPQDYFKIKVVDEETGRGVPMVELKSTNSVRYYTDNNGIIAYFEPGLMDREVYFRITSPGYEYPPDFFGNPGKAFKVAKGDSVIIKIKRKNVAERLYRYTGEGLYHHSLKLGYPVSVKHPVINAEITGLDGTIARLYKNKIFWTWGDTGRLSGAMGHFAISGATSELPCNGGLDPDKGVELTFFEDEKGFSKKMCPIPGPGMVWNFWMGLLADTSGREKLIMNYRRMKSLGETYESGLAVFNDEKEIFEPFFKYDSDTNPGPHGQHLEANIKGDNYYYFSYTMPYSVRTIADLEHIMDVNSYETFTCLKKGTKYSGISSEIDRNEEGEIVYSWKAGSDHVDFDRQMKLVELGIIKEDEGWIQFIDIDNGERIRPQTGSIYWNKYRKKWVMILQSKELLPLGDTWYAEGDTPVGPWIYVKKIATHNKYNFYNVTQHPLFDKENGRFIYFDGTYSILLSQTTHETPRYDYNPIMYRLDLADPRLYLPAPIYSVKNTEGPTLFQFRQTVDSLSTWKKISNIPFLAIPPDRKIDGLIPVYQNITNGQLTKEIKPYSIPALSKSPLFYGLPIFETKYEKLLGTWKCMADQFPLQMDIKISGSNIKASFKEKDLIVSTTLFANDTIVIKIRDATEKDEYIITATVLEGKMKGKLVGVTNKENLTWEGERIDYLWEQHKSPAVTPLYEFRNEDEEYYYSISEKIPGMKRSENPICNVWKNPYRSLIMDIEAKPVPFYK